MNYNFIRNATSPASLLVALAAGLAAWTALWAARAAEPATPSVAPAPAASTTVGVAIEANVDRSPSDLALSADEKWLVTVNETSHSLSLVDVDAGSVVSEIAAGRRPIGLAFIPNQNRLLVACAHSGELLRYELADGKLVPAGELFLGFEPRAVAVAHDGREAYVALAGGAAVAVVELPSLTEVARIEVGRWPRSLVLSPDGARLAVGASGDQCITIVDVKARTLLFQQKFGGINAGELVSSRDGKFVYFPWMIYRQNPINERNIQAGWVLGTRIARVRFDEKALREAMTLDVRRKAVSDPHGIGLTSDDAWLVSTGAGTHELLAYRMQGLVLQDVGGPGDHIDPALAVDRDRFFRIDLGGRPMGLHIAKDDRHVFVANYLDNSVQVVDLAERTVARTIPLGGSPSPSLARQGERIFFDGARSLDQWYSCHSCHYEGGTNAVAMDTFNDGTPRTFKTVLSLRNVAKTAPWTWHGWQTDLRASLHKSMTETMLGPEPTDDDVAALAAYLESLEFAPNPHAGADGPATDAARRGRDIFQGTKAGCSVCHSGPQFTDGQVHDVGLGSPNDAYEGYNTPSLVGVYNRVRFLHDGRAKSLVDALSGPHSPQRVTGAGELTPEELSDLIEYLKTL